MSMVHEGNLQELEGVVIGEEAGSLKQVLHEFGPGAELLSPIEIFTHIAEHSDGWPRNFAKFYWAGLSPAYFETDETVMLYLVPYKLSPLFNDFGEASKSFRAARGYHLKREDFLKLLDANEEIRQSGIDLLRLRAPNQTGAAVCEYQFHHINDDDWNQDECKLIRQLYGQDDATLKLIMGFMRGNKHTKFRIKINHPEYILEHTGNGEALIKASFVSGINNGFLVDLTSHLIDYGQMYALARGYGDATMEYAEGQRDSHACLEGILDANQDDLERFPGTQPIVPQIWQGKRKESPRTTSNSNNTHDTVSDARNHAASGENGTKLGRKRKYINEDFFDTESKEMYYVLGAFCKGYKTKDENKIVFISSRRPLLELVHTLLASDYKISHIQESSHLIEFPSEHMRARLGELGLSERKNARKFLDVPAQYMDHFIRGIVDSMGCISAQQNNPRLITLSFSLNEVFLSDLNTALHTHAGTALRPVYSGRFLTYHHADSIKIRNFIYRDMPYVEENKLYLPSQKEKFDMGDLHQDRIETKDTETIKANSIDALIMAFDAYLTSHKKKDHGRHSMKTYLERISSEQFRQDEKLIKKIMQYIDRHKTDIAMHMGPKGVAILINTLALYVSSQKYKDIKE